MNAQRAMSLELDALIQQKENLSMKLEKANEEIQLLRRKIENHIIMSEDFRRSYEDWLDSLNVEVK